MSLLNNINIYYVQYGFQYVFGSLELEPLEEEEKNSSRSVFTCGVVRGYETVSASGPRVSGSAASGLELSGFAPDLAVASQL